MPSSAESEDSYSVLTYNNKNIFFLKKKDELPIFLNVCDIMKLCVLNGISQWSYKVLQVKEH